MTTKNTKNRCIIFSAPSGSGKTTLVHQMMKKGLPLSFSISATSRAPRKNEIHKKDYHFLSPQEFEKKVESQEFVEWEEVYSGTHYGTLKAELERIFNLGMVPVFDVDVLGGVNLKKILGDQALSIFVQVSSINELEKRLISRDTDSAESIKKRLEKAAYEMSFAPQFDVTIINDDLEIAVEETFTTIQNFIQA
ncbi:MAG: guanylate kinase [Bacteroidetes bacterium 4572_77]|nr:MAG: guanylate kinase [Bacteroidetes bacterium 4572_77]